MSRPKSKIKKGDQVVVISGAYKGVKGTLERVDAARGVAFVDGVPPLKKAVKATQEKPTGGYSDLPRPIALSNVKLA